MHSVDLLIAHYGYFAIFGLLTLGIVGPWIPDETILVLSGLAVHRGQLQLNFVLAAAGAGSLCGITLSYLLGRTGAIYFLERFPPVHRAIGKRLPQVELWFERYGSWTLFFGYFIAGVRHFTALTAGMCRLRYRSFALWAYPGGVVWVACFVAIGFYLGTEWDRLARLFHRGGLIAVGIVLAIAVLTWLLRRRTPIA